MNIKGKSANLNKIIFALQYRFGMTYLDRSGRILNTIIKKYPEWISLDNVSLQGSGLVSSLNRSQFNFSPSQLDFSLDKLPGGRALTDTDQDQFIEQIDLLSRIVIDQLELTEFSRIGCRAWYIFPCTTEQEAEQWQNSLACYNVSNKLAMGFKGKTKATAVSVVIEGERQTFRIALAGVHNKTQVDFGQAILTVQPRSLSKDQNKRLLEKLHVEKLYRENPDFGVMADIDAYQEDPPSISPREFAQENLKLLLPSLKSAFEE